MCYIDALKRIVSRFDIPQHLTDESLHDLVKEQGSLSSIWGFCNRDLSSSDFSKASPAKLFNIPFNEFTVWADDCNNYNWQKVFNECKSPGLGIKALHEKGINGSGINIAIIDKPILATHSEISGTLKEYAFLTNSDKNNDMHFHGMTCASFACGKTTGVAPNASLFYIAYPDYFENETYYWNYYFAAFDRIIQHNTKTDNKIHIVSVSAGVPTSQKEILQKVYDYTERMAQDKCYMIFSNLFGQTFTCGSKKYNVDFDNPECYVLDSWQTNPWDKERILVPAGGRTSACCSGENRFMYFGNQSCYSWAIPYLCGVFALALQINNNLEYKSFCEIASNTATVNSEGLNIINPIGIIRNI